MEATIRLYGEIESNAANYFAWRLDDLCRWGIDGEKCDCVEVRINSVGGYVTEGLGIYGAIISSKIPVETYIDGVAMSMGLVIAQAGTKRYMARHAICMMHPVQPGENSDPASIEKMNTSILDILAKRATCTREEMQAMMDKTTYLDAEECLALGLVDEIFDLIPESEMDPELEPGKEMDKAKCVAIMTATNKFLANSLQNNMETVAKAKYDELATNLADLKAKADADLAAANAKAEEATNKLTEANEKLAKVEAELTAFRTEQATNLIDGAVAQGKITEEAKNTWLEKANADFSGTKSLIEGLAVNRQAPHLILGEKNEGKITAIGVMMEIQAKHQKN